MYKCVKWFWNLTPLCPRNFHSSKFAFIIYSCLLVRDGTCFSSNDDPQYYKVKLKSGWPNSDENIWNIVYNFQFCPPLWHSCVWGVKERCYATPKKGCSRKLFWETVSYWVSMLPSFLPSETMMVFFIEKVRWKFMLWKRY